MTSTYLHVNCVVGVACAEAFANKNIASRTYVDASNDNDGDII